MQAMTVYAILTLENKASFVGFLALGLFVFGAFIILDLRALGTRIQPEDYIMGAFTLYVDLMTFFVHIIALFGNKKR